MLDLSGNSKTLASEVKNMALQMGLFQELGDRTNTDSAHSARRLGLSVEVQIQSAPSSGSKTAHCHSYHDFQAAVQRDYCRAAEKGIGGDQAEILQTLKFLPRFVSFSPINPQIIASLWLTLGVLKKLILTALPVQQFLLIHNGFSSRAVLRIQPYDPYITKSPLMCGSMNCFQMCMNLRNSLPIPFCLCCSRPQVICCHGCKGQDSGKDLSVHLHTSPEPLHPLWAAPYSPLACPTSFHPLVFLGSYLYLLCSTRLQALIGFPLPEMCGLETSPRK